MHSWRRKKLSQVQRPKKSLKKNTKEDKRSAAAAAAPLQLCPTLCDPIDGRPPGSPVPGILQARTLEWVAISFSPSLGFSRQEHWSGLPFPSPMHESESEVTQSCPTLSDLMDCSPPGSSVHGVFQARVLEWGAIAFSDTRSRASKRM